MTLMPMYTAHTAKETRVWIWGLLILSVLIVSLFTRITLLVISFEQIDVSVINFTGMFLIGFFYDILNAVYFSLPLVLYLWLCPSNIFTKSWHRHLTIFWFLVFNTGLIFNAVAELLFWDEFEVRFNFIAVDYLIYTTEVIGNINQSYPIAWIIGAVIIASIAATAFISVFIPHIRNDISFKQRTKYAITYITIFGFIFWGVDSKFRQFSNNTYVNELAGNGLYELFAAYNHNELNYDQFYKSLPEAEVTSLMRDLLTTSEIKWKSDTTGIERTVTNPEPAKELNVVFISIESFSADFMGLFGNKKNLTPYLDSLTKHSLVFTNLYATGTRTVRGLEALSLCVPPTPGQSIVRRPNNEHLFSVGKVFYDNNYNCKYLYGGYGYFDNMNYFFVNNEYQVVDRTQIDERDIHYENVWGVADEDLFALTERQANRVPTDQPFFFHVLTTSNHRPFTYPEGRIDIPSRTGRDGAVKYTDYAIGNFIKKASRQKWFDNTIFVIVADHCASSAGKTELPVDKYHIPMLIYSPKHIQPGVMDRLMSQIDVGPTLLGLLNFSYDSKFFGYDMFKLEPGRERAFISTYQSLGYLKNQKLVILNPQKRAVTYELSKDMKPIKPIIDTMMLKEAVAWYQTASHSFKNGQMRHVERQVGLNNESQD